jgi:molecular chaperone HscB
MDDYFALFDLPRRLDIDLEDLGRRLRKKSFQVHPDLHARGSTADRERALEATARLNEAYRVLKDPFRRARHLLDLEGVDSDRRLPADLLAAVFEVQELLEDPDAPRAELTRAHGQWQERWENLLTELQSAATLWSGGDRQALDRVADILVRRRTVENLLAALAQRIAA